MRRSVRNSLKIGVPLVAMGLVGIMLIPAQPARIGTARIAPIAAAAKAAGLPIPGGARAASVTTPTPAAARLEAQLTGQDTTAPAAQDSTASSAGKPGVELASLTGSPPATTTPDAPVPAGTQPDLTQPATPASANATDTSTLPSGQIGPSGVNVRSGPSSADGKLFVLPPGESVKVGETNGGWVHVYRQDGTDGWIYGRYLNKGAVTSAASADISAAPAGAAPSAIPTRTAMTPPAQSQPTPARLPPPQTASMARLMSVVPLLQRPDDFGTTLGVLQPGERVRVLNSDGRWLHVVTEDGATGWIPA